MIRHTVVFRLKHPKGSAEEKAFLAAADVLAKIPGVEKFEKLRQVSAKNGYAYGFSMEFTDEAAYRATTTTPTTCASSRSAGCRRWRSSWRSITSGFESRSASAGGAPGQHNAR